MTPIADTMRISEVKDRALAYDMPGFRVDGNDPEAVYQAMSEAVERGRSGGGPTLLEMVTFRFKGHYTGDPQRYMPKGELADAQTRDPIPLYRARLIDQGLATADDLAAIEKAATDEVEDALQTVLAAPVPPPDELELDFFENMKGIPS